MACDCANLDWSGVDQSAAHHPACSGRMLTDLYPNGMGLDGGGRVIDEGNALGGLTGHTMDEYEARAKRGPLRDGETFSVGPAVSGYVGVTGGARIESPLPADGKGPPVEVRAPNAVHGGDWNAAGNGGFVEPSAWGGMKPGVPYPLLPGETMSDAALRLGMSKKMPTNAENLRASIDVFIAYHQGIVARLEALRADIPDELPDSLFEIIQEGLN